LDVSWQPSSSNNPYTGSGIAERESLKTSEFKALTARTGGHFKTYTKGLKIGNL